MKTITIGQLRQNPAPMLADVEAGETYQITRHSREIARIVPRDHALELLPPKSGAGSHLSRLPRHELRTAASIDDLLEDERDR